MSDQPTVTQLADVQEELARTQHDLDQTRRELIATRAEADHAIPNLRRAAAQLHAIRALVQPYREPNATTPVQLTELANNILTALDGGTAPVPGSSQRAQEPVTIPNLPTASTVDLIADLIERQITAPPAVARRCAEQLARDILALLVGDDNNPGPLDRYQIAATVVGNSGKPLVTWYCPDNHAESGAGHVGIIARDFDGDQTGLTLGEIAASALAHEDEDHA